MQIFGLFNMAFDELKKKHEKKEYDASFFIWFIFFILMCLCIVGAIIGNYEEQQKNLKEQDYFKKMKEQADQGDKKAQYRVAKMYASGTGVEVDHKKAIEYYKKSDEQGFLPASQKLASIYEYGTGVAVNHKKAMEYSVKGKQHSLDSIIQSATQGNIKDQYKLGLIYENGISVPKNLEIACKCFSQTLFITRSINESSEQKLKEEFNQIETLAKQGSQENQWKLGFMYEKGIGVPKDLKKACALYKIAFPNF